MSAETKSSTIGSEPAEPRTRFPAAADAFMLMCCLAWFAALFLSLARTSPPLPDFSALETQARKEAFFDYLSPIVRKINGRSLEEKAFVQNLAAKTSDSTKPSWFERARVDALAQKYEVETEAADFDEVLATLELRIGVVPEPLVLIQAAKESGWGTSRFAVEGNNLFGQRCYEKGCGIAPRGRAKEARFGVASFDSVEQAIESYTLNLNTHPRYRDFRELRQSLRALGKPLEALELAEGLLAYSERGQVYVDEIKSMIRQNGLE